MTFIIFLFLVPSFCFGEDDLTAVKSADTFLNGIKLVFTPEGKEMMSRTSWFTEKQYPLYSDITTLSEGMFPTDIPHVEGFKRLLQITEINPDGRSQKKHYLLISYRDTVNGQWKVFDFRESTDAALEALIACKDPDIQVIVGEEVLQSSQYNYFQCGYWSAMSGKVTEAMEAFRKAFELNKQKTDRNISQRDIEHSMQAIKRIIGK